jgi:hypothetical protein
MRFTSLVMLIPLYLLTGGERLRNQTEPDTPPPVQPQSLI